MGRCVSGRCRGVRESSSQPLTPKGTAPLLHCPPRAQRRAAFSGACPRPGPHGNAGCPLHRRTGHLPGPLRRPVEPLRRGPRGRPGGVAQEERNPPFRGSRPTPGVRPEPTARSAPGTAGRAVFGSPPGPVPGGGRRTPRRGRRPRRGGVRGRAGAPGCAPVERLISAHATVHFQPTSRTGPFLVEMADQPPCHQAGRDRAVRFGPMGTGHERRTHFPARAASETLRDRTLPARLPCRQ